MRTRLDSCDTLPTDERAPGVPRACCSATAGGRPVDLVDVGHAHLVDQPARVRRHRFEVAPLRLRVDRAERERGLARARDAGEDDQRVARDRDVDVLQVVLARAAHAHEAAATPSAQTAAPQAASRRPAGNASAMFAAHAISRGWIQS
jgi:hypothetical protein